ncbi:MAG TPA: DUF3857 domain-containing protein [Woeseiaceae bacterium]|nr:DUF3857 domain-containing protein [Woeseiaceae bacterium]
MIRSLCILIILAIATGSALAEPEVGKTAVADWVVEQALEDFAHDREGQFQLGIAYLLSDRQVRKTSGGYEYFERQVYEVIERSGLESAATVIRLFDPANGTLAFNFIRVTRDGEVVDRLPDAEITILRQEEGLDSSLIDGNLTAVIQLKDIRVGDVVDYAVSGTVESPLWPGEFFDLASVQWSMPLAQMHFRLSVPEDLPLTPRGVATDIRPLVTTEDGWTTFELSVRDPDPVRVEQDVPDDWIQFGFIVFSTMDSWSDIVDWALPVFTIDEPLPSQFLKKLDDIAASFPRSEERISHVLRLVQEDIRYLGIEVGLGSHVPRPPAVTLRRGYGDCKDKAVLLVAALDYFNIDAAPALASLQGGKSLATLPPTIDAFDHVIVQIDLGEQEIWVDPTLSHQGGTLGALSPLDYGFVLPVRADQATLVKLDVPMPDVPTDEISETLRFPDGGDIGLRLTIEYTSRRAAADFARLMVAGIGRESLARTFLDHYSALYPGLKESRPLAVSDDLEGNVVVYRAEYEMDSDVFEDGNLGHKLPIVASAVQGLLPRRVEAERIAPLRLPYGTKARHVIRIETPGQMLFLPSGWSDSVAGISYAQTYSSDGEAFEVEYMLTVADKVAEPELIKTITTLAEKIAEDTELKINLDMALPTVSRQLDLATPLSPDTEKTLMLIRSQMAQQQNVEALTSLNALINKYTEPAKLQGYLQLQKAIVLTSLNRNRAALAPFAEAFRLFEPPDPRSYFLYFWVLGNEGETAKASEVLILLLTRHASAVNDIDVDWLSSLIRYLRRSGLSEELENLEIALARALHDTQSKNLDELRWVFVPAIEALSQAGKDSEALQYLDYVQNPKDIADLLTNNKTAAIWSAIEQRWGQDLSKAFTEYVSTTESAATAAPNDYSKKTHHLAALRIAGRIDEALEYAAPIIENWPRIEAVGEDAYWFVNGYAFLLAQSGSSETAFALMTRLENFGIRENGSLVSMAINHIELLQFWGEFESALHSIEVLEGLGRDVASDFGWVYIYGIKACALYQLDRIEESETVLAESIMPIAEKNPGGYTETLLCLNKLDEAAAIIVDRLQDDDQQRNAIRAFVETTATGPKPSFLAELEARAGKVRARPDVQKAFKKVGRVISTGEAQLYWGSF